MDSFKPVWPETVVVWGAGATRALGAPTTADQQTIITTIADGFRKHEDTKIIAEKIGSGSSQEIDAFSEYLRKVEPKQDKLGLFDIIELTPRRNNSVQLMDLFNILDMHIISGRGIYSSGKFLSPSNLINARKELCSLISHILYIRVNNASNIDSNLEKYRGFLKSLSELMQEEGETFINDGVDPSKRDFYLFSYAVISLNWDPILLCLLFEAHTRANNFPPSASVDSTAIPLKLYNDLGFLCPMQAHDAKSPELWYPFNESNAQRCNKKEHRKTRIVRIGKYYFPHGSTSLRQCPNCGKPSFNLGISGDPRKDASPAVRYGTKPQDKRAWKQETESWEKNEFDVRACRWCGEKTLEDSTIMVMQTSFKGNDPWFINEIQYEERVVLQNAKHIVLLGYSIPPDDVYMRALLASSAKNKNENEKLVVSIVGYDSSLPKNRWILGEELKEGLTQNKKATEGFWYTVNQAKEVFGDSAIIRAYCGGIPNVFEYLGDYKSSAFDLLYPEVAFPKGRVVRSG